MGSLVQPQAVFHRFLEVLPRSQISFRQPGDRWRRLPAGAKEAWLGPPPRLSAAAAFRSQAAGAFGEARVVVEFLLGVGRRRAQQIMAPCIMDRSGPTGWPTGMCSSRICGAWPMATKAITNACAGAGWPRQWPNGGTSGWSDPNCWWKHQSRS